MESLNQLAGRGVKFVILKIDETSNWNEEIADKAGKIEGVYLVDLTQPTHLCEISVSYPVECLKNFIQNFEAFSENELSELENESLGSTYFAGGSIFKIEKEYSDERDFEEVMEYERGNPTVC